MISACGCWAWAVLFTACSAYRPLASVIMSLPLVTHTHRYGRRHTNTQSDLSVVAHWTAEIAKQSVECDRLISSTYRPHFLRLLCKLYYCITPPDKVHIVWYQAFKLQTFFASQVWWTGWERTKKWFDMYFAFIFELHNPAFFLSICTYVLTKTVAAHRQLSINYVASMFDKVCNVLMQLHAMGNYTVSQCETYTRLISMQIAYPSTYSQYLRSIILASGWLSLEWHPSAEFHSSGRRAGLSHDSYKRRMHFAR